MSPLALQRKRSITPCITDRDPLPDTSSDKDPGSPRVSEGTPPLSRFTERGGSFKERCHSQCMLLSFFLKGPLSRCSVARCWHHLPTFVNSQRNVAASAQRLRGTPTPCLGLSSPREQQRCPGGEGGVSADGRGRGLLRPGLPQLLPLLASGWQSPRDGPRHRQLLRVRARRFLPRLQPGCRLSTLQQL